MTLPPESFLQEMLGAGTLAGTQFHSTGGTTWDVRPADLDDAVGEHAVIVLVAREEASEPVWVGNCAGDWCRLDGSGIARYFAANHSIAKETAARLIGACLGPGGPERVLLTDREVDSLLAEAAGRIAPTHREFRFDIRKGGWRTAFLAAVLRQSPQDRLWRLTVARWAAAFTQDPPNLVWQREELISDVLLDRYRP